jgi:thiopeptide-type bacteriocin biosynthesis protein
MDGERKGANGWSAWHVFLPPDERFEAVLAAAIEAAHQCVGRNKGRWFFIRYAENGYHFRLRLRDEGPDALATFDAALVALVETVTSHPARIARVPYEPEIRRYGGPRALLVNEQLFSIASEIAARLIALSGPFSNERASNALDLMLAVPAALGHADLHILRYFRGYAEQWDRFMRKEGLVEGPSSSGLSIDGAQIATRTAALHAARDAPGKSLTSLWVCQLAQASAAFAAIAAEGALISPLTGKIVKTAEDTQNAVDSMLTSQLHMLSNRLGVSPMQEYHLATAIANAIEAVVEAAPSQ